VKGLLAQPYLLFRASSVYDACDISPSERVVYARRAQQTRALAENPCRAGSLDSPPTASTERFDHCAVLVDLVVGAAYGVGG
jgi:hypothetical protein